MVVLHESRSSLLHYPLFLDNTLPHSLMMMGIIYARLIDKPKNKIIFQTNTLLELKIRRMVKHWQTIHHKSFSTTAFRNPQPPEFQYMPYIMHLTSTALFHALTPAQQRVVEQVSFHSVFFDICNLHLSCTFLKPLASNYQNWRDANHIFYRLNKRLILKYKLKNGM